VSRPRIACECVPRGAGYHGFGYAARVKDTHPQPRSPRRRAFRAGRRVIMWAALVAAIGIGVVWAGGRSTWFYWDGWFWEARPDEERALIVRGLLGGIAIEWRTLRSMMMESSFDPDVNMLRWMWWPSWTQRPWGVWNLLLPYWIPTLLCLTTFALLFRVDRRERRLARAGHCVCGYSLAGLASGAVCPECGKGKTLT